MGRTAATENTDYLNRDLAAVVDFMETPTGGVSMEGISDREFDMASAEGRLAYEKFMNEPVVVKIHKTSDQNEPTVADLGLNGARIAVPRDVPVRLRRAFVEVLARSQMRGYSQQRNPNPMADEGMVTKRHGGASYPFQVIEDKNPRGRAWLQRVTFESA